MNNYENLAEVIIGLERYERINKEDIPLVVLILKNRLNLLLMKEYLEESEVNYVSNN